MCGRYGLTLDQEALGAAYGVEKVLAEHSPRYNIAPTDTAPVLLSGEEGAWIERLRWGLVPWWAKDPRIGNRMINARAETVSVKPAFRDAWHRKQRCVVLADGFYEWQAPAGGKGAKQPHWISLENERPFGLAGLWDVWRGGDEELRTFTIIVTDSNATVRPIHDRMPVVLRNATQWNAWVNSDTPPEAVSGLLRPYPGDDLRARPVSAYVNKPGNEGPECLVRPGEG